MDQSVAGFEEDTAFSHELIDDYFHTISLLPEEGDPFYWPSLIDEFLTCCSSVFSQVLSGLLLTLCLCLGCRILRLLSQTYFKVHEQQNSSVPLFEQLISLASGVTLLWYFFGASGAIALGFSLCLCIIFVFDPSSSHRTHGFSLSNTVLHLFLVCCSTLIYCELLMDPTQWHRIRGSIMLIIMRAVSFALDLHHPTKATNIHSKELIHNDSRLCHCILWLSYALCPATLIFGPWFSVHQYYHLYYHYPESGIDKTVHIRDSLLALWHSIVHAIKTLSCALACLLWSTCISHVLLPDWKEHIWLNAYVASQSFRFSHYFVSYSSEAFVAIYGLGYSQFSPIPSLEQRLLYTPIHVTKLMTIEFPRSLVDVVVNWNLPMHMWLKQYVYKPLRPHGHLYAILGTYIISSLLHGTNFQLSAVLLSIGVFAYVEFVFRDRVATALDACVRSRPCRAGCQHKAKERLWVHLINIGFSLLAMFHLAYLAVMFDMSEEQAQGYSMQHVVNKWSEFGFLNHIVVLATYIAHKCITP